MSFCRQDFFIYFCTKPPFSYFMDNTFYSRKQEIVNSLIHGFGVILGLSCLPILISLAVSSKNVYAIIGVGVYSFCFLLMLVNWIVN